MLPEAAGEGQYFQARGHSCSLVRADSKPANNEIYLLHKYIYIYQSRTAASRNLKLKFLRNKTRNYICLYVVRRYKNVVFVTLL